MPPPALPTLTTGYAPPPPHTPARTAPSRHPAVDHATRPAKPATAARRTRVATNAPSLCSPAHLDHMHHETMTRIVLARQRHHLKQKRLQQNLQMNTMARKRDLPGCLSLLDRMRRAGVRPDRYTYSIALTCCARVRAVDVALALMDRMQEDGVCMDDYIRTNLLVVGAQCEPPRLALCTQMFGMCGRPSRYMCNVMMDAYARVGAVEECREMVRFMSVRGMVADRYAVSALVKAYVSGGRLADAVGVLAEMHDAGLEVNAAAFGLVMDAFGKRAMLDEAVAVFDSMTLFGVPPTQVTYNILIGACVNAGFTARAFEFYDEMRATSDFRGDRYTMHTLMKSCLQDNRPAQALSLYRAERETPFQNNQVTWRLALIAAGMLMDLDAVHEVHVEMAERGILPRGDTAAVGVAAAVRCSDLQLALKLFGEWHKSQEAQEEVGPFLKDVRAALKSFERDVKEGGMRDFEQTLVVVDELEKGWRRRHL